jgi:flagellar hook-associated protein FlgK
LLQDRKTHFSYAAFTTISKTFMSPIYSSAGNYQTKLEIPLTGMRKANAQANKAAIKIAGGDLDPGSFVELMGAQYTFEANAKVMKVMDENLGTLLNTVA